MNYSESFDFEMHKQTGKEFWRQELKINFIPYTNSDLAMKQYTFAQ